MIEIELCDFEEEDEIIVSQKTVKIKNDTYMYDKYDIIDFLEADYIDWLNSIPTEYWDKYKKDVEKFFYKITDERVMDLVMKKVKINLPKYVIDNFEKITLKVLKYCVEKNFTKLDIQIKKTDYKFNYCIKDSIINKDIDFNKYFYENLYFKFEPTHQYNGLNTDGNFFLLEDIHIHKANRFYENLKFIIPTFYRTISNYKVIKYLNDKFPNIFQNNLQKNKESIYDMYVNIFKESKINNWNDMIELKNILNVSNFDFSKKILIGNIHHYGVRNLLLTICKSGDVELVFKTINNLWSDEFKNTSNIINIMSFSSLSKNYELVFMLYNFFTYEKNITFNASICSHIVEKIIYNSDKKYREYDKIIYEWLNLGGVVKGYSIYTDYIESIKIIKKS